MANSISQKRALSRTQPTPSFSQKIKYTHSLSLCLPFLTKAKKSSSKHTLTHTLTKNNNNNSKYIHYRSGSDLLSSFTREKKNIKTHSQQNIHSRHTNTHQVGYAYTISPAKTNKKIKNGAKTITLHNFLSLMYVQLSTAALLLFFTVRGFSFFFSYFDVALFPGAQCTYKYLNSICYAVYLFYLPFIFCWFIPFFFRFSVPLSRALCCSVQHRQSLKIIFIVLFCNIKNFHTAVSSFIFFSFPITLSAWNIWFQL